MHIQVNFNYTWTIYSCPAGYLKNITTIFPENLRLLNKRNAVVYQIYLKKEHKLE